MRSVIEGLKVPVSKPRGNGKIWNGYANSQVPNFSLLRSARTIKLRPGQMIDIWALERRILTTVDLCPSDSLSLAYMCRHVGARRRHARKVAGAGPWLARWTVQRELLIVSLIRLEILDFFIRSAPKPQTIPWLAPVPSRSPVPARLVDTSISSGSSSPSAAALHERTVPRSNLSFSSPRFYRTHSAKNSHVGCANRAFPASVFRANSTAI